VKELSVALRKRQPDCISNLILSSNIDQESRKKISLLERTIQDLKENLLLHQNEYDMRIRSLKLDHERIKSEYEETIRNLKSQLKTIPRQDETLSVGSVLFLKLSSF
jgi:uncharacterized protein (DUF342 family)